MSTVAIIGDVGGHADQLDGCLARLGVTATSWPQELVVVQLGDLLGGVDDMACVEMVEQLLNAGRWVQLLGNWDSRQIGGGWWFHSARRGEPDPAAEERVADWYKTGGALHAAAVTTRAGASAVVTHAGVAAPFWRQVLGAVDDPIEAVGRLNGLPTQVLHQPGRMLGIEPTPTCGDQSGIGPDGAAEQTSPPVGPIWADCAELWSSWFASPSPWPQVHGHTSAWFRNDWSDYVPVDCIPFAAAISGCVIRATSRREGLVRR